MATTAKQRRRRKNRRKKKLEPAGATTTTVHDLPDHIFERILLCLGPSPCLVRAAAACRGWCRVVADAGFLARLRSAHPHGGTRLGHYYCNGLFRRRLKSTVFVPFIPAAAIVVHHRCRFNLDLLPGGRGSWELVDSRGSLLLLTKLTRLRHSMHFDLLVYEPLTGRQQLFHGPSDLADAFLADGGGDDSCQIGKTIFRVLAVAHEYIAHEYVPCVYSSGRDGSLHLVHAGDVSMEQVLYKATFVGRTGGSIYWRILGRDDVLALDEATAQFSVIQFPVNIWGAHNMAEHASRVIGGEDGALRIVRLMSNELKIFVRRRWHPASNGRDDEWVLEKHLGLPEEATMIATANSKYVILTPTVTRPGQILLFSVELDTMQVEREHERNKYNGEVHPYELPWPPVLPDITSH